MARKSKRSRGRVSRNIAKLVREYKRTGKIKTSRATYRPKSLRDAARQAAAIEYGRERSEES
ncbi:hypothetical protein MPNT_350002 [Candidatus Methylacidithermus pantelleriae]|uniref:Uncharacterized protein n=1 Tax=Candidatus Methylacidithermus pantelleriae TaxID=2744239 RepID=A0A8J2BTX9_9BACT|nr:hypothetical protein MPNT_350002 [Candidatus Methylacidithermus pantelleriae]